MYSDLHKSIAMAFVAKGGKLGFDCANIVAGSTDVCIWNEQPSNLFKTHCFSPIASIMLDHLGDEIPDFWDHASIFSSQMHVTVSKWRACDIKLAIASKNK